jgi:hypothetical protein
MRRMSCRVEDYVHGYSFLQNLDFFCAFEIPSLFHLWPNNCWPRQECSKTDETEHITSIQMLINFLDYSSSYHTISEFHPMAI